MSKDSSSWRQMADSVISIFTNNGTIDMDKLNYIMTLALEDDEVDEKEKQVLRGIFSQFSEETVTPEVWSRMNEIREKYSI